VYNVWTYFTDVLENVVYKVWFNAGKSWAHSQLVSLWLLALGKLYVPILAMLSIDSIDDKARIVGWKSSS